jgi:alginate O-acetyltransferase complex protein AlgI
MLLGGLWHGASWNFLLWGALHGLYLVIERLVRGYAAGISALGGIAGQALGIGATYALVCIAWIPFRADSIQTSLWMMLGAVGLNSPTSIMLRRDLLVIPVIAGMLGVQLACRRVRLEEWVSRAPAWVIVCAGVAMLLSILMNSGASRAFVYFQF